MGYDKTLQAIEQAFDILKEAQASIAPGERKIKVPEAYILGSFKMLLSNLSVCKSIVKDAIASQSRVERQQAPPDPPLLHD